MFGVLLVACLADIILDMQEAVSTLDKVHHWDVKLPHIMQIGLIMERPDLQKNNGMYLMRLLHTFLQQNP